MTQRSVLYLKGKFETGDVPVQSDYQDVFDSFLSLEASTQQTLNGPVVIPSVSASAVWIAGSLVRSAAIAVSATGTTQAAGYHLVSDFNYVFTTDDASRAVVLASPKPGSSQVVVNSNASALYVYPSPGCNFVGTAADSKITLAAGGCLIAHHVGVSAYGIIRTQGV